MFAAENDANACHGYSVRAANVHNQIAMGPEGWCNGMSVFAHRSAAGAPMLRTPGDAVSRGRCVGFCEFNRCGKHPSEVVAASIQSCSRSLACEEVLTAGRSGYCVCGAHLRVLLECDHGPTDCSHVCAKALEQSRARAHLQAHTPQKAIALHKATVHTPQIYLACSFRPVGRCNTRGVRNGLGLDGRTSTQSDETIRECDALVPSDQSGYCLCDAKKTRRWLGCGHPPQR